MPLLISGANGSFSSIADISFARHTSTMRTLLPSLALAFVLGCTARQPQSGWEYRAAHGAYAAQLYYCFRDGEGTTLIGSCEGEPSFLMARGSWNGPKFTVTVDNKSWTLPTRQGEHGRYLPVDVLTANEAIAGAKQRIVFQVGSWRREIRPGAPLTSFAANCS